MVRLLSLALLALPVALLGGGAAPRRQPAPDPVKLVVLVYFDQFRGDYLGRWGHLFGDGGFNRLTADGAWFADCHYPYATTTTGAGHASVASGCGAAGHGIINNNWYDRAAGEEVYCATTARHQFVPAPTTPKEIAGAKVDAKRKKPKQAGTPERLLADTVADQLKAAGGRVFGLSLKDRSAIFPSGHKPDGAYWFDGRFVTSTYYRDTLPKWVSEFNTSGAADKWVGKTWERFKPDLDYTALVGPDDVLGEGVGKGAATKQGKTFPHPYEAAAGDDYYEQVAYSPAGNDLLLAFAKKCIVAENLGRGDRPDLLTLSFSSNDLVGHVWGPDSQEVLDVTLRSDRTMAELLLFLDGVVGAGKYAVVMTADHGVCPIPEVSASHGLPARRIPPAPLVLAAERFLQDTYGKPAVTGGRWLEALYPPHVYLNHRLLASKGINPATAADELARWLEHQPGIEKAYTPRMFLRRDLDPVRQKVQACYHPDRGGDVFVVTKAYDLLDDQEVGTSHGTPHEYDTHVPLVVFAPGVAGGRKMEPVTPLHAAAVASRLLGVRPPSRALYPVPATLYP